MAKRRARRTIAGWFGEYLRFLGRMAVRHPRVFVTHVVRWTLYSMAPGITRRSNPSRVYHCDEVDQAAEAFRRDGFVVLSDALDPDDARALREVVKAKADQILQGHEAGVLPPEFETIHGQNRYSWGEYGHNPEWEYLGRNERVLDVLRRIWEGHGFRAVGAGGDFVLPGGTWQALHNDMAWKGAGEEVPRVLTVNYYVSDVGATNGPIRLVPGTTRFPVPPLRVIERFEPRWMKESIITGMPGYAIIRDPRGWHGGTPNTSSETRYMPNIEYVLSDAPQQDIEGTAALDQISRGEWIAEYAAS